MEEDENMKKDENKAPQIVNMEVLNNAVINLEKFMEPLSLIEKQLVIQQLTARMQSQARNVGINDTINHILPGWMTKHLNKDEDK